MSETSLVEKLCPGALEGEKVDDRATFLDDARAGEPALHARVDQLLAAHNSADPGSAPNVLATVAFRPEDRSADRWTTANRVLENEIRDGIPGRNPANGRRSTTRPVGSVTEDIQLNRGTGTLSE